MRMKIWLLRLENVSIRILYLVRVAARAVYLFVATVESDRLPLSHYLSDSKE